MLVVADTDDVFIPLLDGFFVKPSEAKSMLQRLADTYIVYCITLAMFKNGLQLTVYCYSFYCTV